MTSAVYIVGSNPSGPIKIGFSTNLENRLKSLQAGYEKKLTLFKKIGLCPEKAAKLERVLHTELIDKRLEGEWFVCSVDEAVRAFNRIKEKTKSFRDWSAYRGAEKTGLMKLHAQKGVATRLKNILIKTDKIADRWPKSSDEFPTKVLLAEAGISLNTAKAHLGKRPIAQYNYQAAQKRKERRNAKR